ncbi:MAG: sensor histidine kinase [Calditrichaeota bacterium]|nr:MAG: sensor histidine kinase [Calditrichota bacterium]
MKWFQSFYGRLSLIFLILLFILGAVQSYLTMHSWQNYYYEADQKLNRRLAADMSREFAPFLKDSLDLSQVEHAIHYMMVINPKIEIYVLDEQGKILAFFAEPGKKVAVSHVALEPIRRFLENDAEQTLITGSDPRHPEERKPFSAAALNIGPDQKGYLYIVLGGELFEEALASSREGYVAQTIVKGLLLTVFFTAVIGLILFAVLTGRLRRISNGMSLFEKGAYQTRLPENSNDELGRVAHTFNRMAETIEANIEELKKTDTLRRELIANVSHDLRSPLASIRGYLETLHIKKGHLSDEEQDKYMRIILDATRSLEQLVSQLFELSKLDANQIEPHMEPFLIKELAFEVKMKLTPQAEMAGVSLEVAIPEELPQVYGDIALIERVLTNLIENAIRYSPRGSRVVISTDLEGESLRVRVMDNGPGIDEEKLPFIFDRFYRVEGSRSGKTGGSGLGLAIAKKIMEVHQSALTVASKKGEGSAFSFKLPTWKTA